VPADQVGQVQETPVKKRASHPGQMQHQGITAQLLRRPVYRDISRKMSQLRRTLGSKSTTDPTVGDRRSFYVRDVLNLSRWNDVKAELVARAPRVQFWMAVGEVEAFRKRGSLQVLLDSIRKRTVHRTPSGSVDPDRGIVPIENTYFGQPPNVDGDGRTDVLLLDIEDRFEQTGSYIAGFFDPNDLTRSEYSNRRDLLYVDTRPTILRGNKDSVLHFQEATATIAHEYQHLIQAHYEGRTRERTFVNEGLSEFAEILCGFPPRSAKAYLGAPGRPLLNWNYDAPLPDYARASLFAHYFFEQIGREWADDLVQTRKVGLDGLRAVLRKAGGPSFEALFRNWGRALLLNDRTVDPAYGYSHPDRRDVRFEKAETIEGVPGTVDRKIGALSHTPLEVPLVERLTIRAESRAEVRYDARLTYPGAPDRLRMDLAAGHRLSLDEAPHGSVRLLASNLSLTPDSGRVDAQFLARGRRTAHRTTLRYGDGAPDPYSGSASYLLLDEPGEATGVTFGPRKEETWLHGVSVDVVFLSELVGSEVPNDAPRRVTVRVRSLDGRRPGRALTPPLTRTVDRSFGNLKLEPVSLLRQYESLSALRDSFVVVLRSGTSKNPLAVGMDRTTGRTETGSAFHRARDSTAWTPIHRVRAEGTRLAGYRPLIHARTAMPETRIPSRALQLDARHDFDRAYVRLQAPFPLDSSNTELIGRLPSGNIVEGRWTSPDSTTPPLRVRSPSEVVFQFPAGTGADYHLHARAESEDQVVARASTTWRIPDEDAVRVGAAFPNPTPGDAHLSMTLLDPARVTVRLYDVLGRLVRRIPPRKLSAGDHQLDLSLRALASGTYVARVETKRLRDGYVDAVSRKIVRIR
jgi:hypothetical protein